MFRRVKWISAIPKFAQSYLTNVTPANSRVMKVAVLGAAGETGRCLSLLLKRSSIVDELALYDILPVESLTLELNHIDAPCKVNGYSGLSGIEDALRRAKVVIVTAGIPAKYKRTGSEIVNTNANVLADLIPHVIRYSPRAMVAVATSPVNILIPLIAEMYKKAGYYDLNNLFGITTLDCVRSNTFAAKVLRLPPETVVVPVIGGNCAKTCIPLFSKITPSYEFTNEEISRLTLSVKVANEELLRAYNGNGSPSLSMAFAAARFCVSLCKGLRGLPGVVECAYVRSCVVPDVTYFASPVELGPNGVQRNLGVPPLTDYECKMMNSAIPIIQDGIRIGEAFVCLNTFPEKVTQLNNLIDEYTPDAIKKSRENVNQQTAPSCLSINSTTRDYYFHDGITEIVIPELKRWLQALTLASNPPNPSLSQAIRTTETIDGWAYELFFHLKYLQVINFPCEVDQENCHKELPGRAETSGSMMIFPKSDTNLTDDSMHTNLWHRIVQLRDHYVILFETLRTNSEFTEPEDRSKNHCPVSE